MNVLAIGLAALACLVLGPTAVAASRIDPVAADRSRALHDDPQASQALIRVLRYHHAKEDGEGGFEWWLRLPFPVRARQAPVPEVRVWRNRLEFLRDAQRGDAAACAVSGGMVLRDPLLDQKDRVIETQRLARCQGSSTASQ